MKEDSPLLQRLVPRCGRECEHEAHEADKPHDPHKDDVSVM